MKMEDLYADLENYQYENVVSELKNENQVLKTQLEEYASTLASLQKDFDKLSAEYKNLEQNYSSLLKTARAEIERKSQLITNLNIEKDKLIIDSIQNTGRKPNRKINAKGNKQQTAKQSGKDGDSTKNENAGTVFNLSDNNISGTSNNDPKNKHENAMFPLDSNFKDNPDLKEREQKLERCDIYDRENNETKKSKDNSSDALVRTAVNTDKTRISLNSNIKDNPEIKEKDQKFKKFDHCIRDREKKKNEVKKSKQTDSEVFNTDVLANKVSKIRSRRKSMPLLNRGDFKFSSDEEQGDDPKDHRFRRKIPVRDERMEIDRYHDKYREHHGRYEPERKVSELARMGDRQVVHYDTSRDAYRKNNSWYRDSDRYNSKDNRDRYETNKRSRRYFSPNRAINTQAEYYNKHGDSNDRSYRFDNIRRRTLVSPPPETYRQHRRSREFDGPRFHQDGLYPVKHKIHDVIEEPACKRFRSESQNKASDKQIMLHDRDLESRASSTSRPLELSCLSLQSPDYVYLENHPPVHQVKEIKGTSESKLDDPRLTSKKYKVNNYKDKVVLSTVGGRDIDLKPVDTTIWNTNKDKYIHEMPTALMEKPPITDDFINDIYLGIDNPPSNLSLESGEICLEDEMDTVSENQRSDNPEGTDIKNVSNKVQSHDQIEVNKIESVDKIDNEQQACSTLFTKKYKIPKINKSHTSKSLEDDTCNKRDKISKKDNNKQSHKKKNRKEKRDLEKKLQAESNNYKSSSASEVCRNKKHKLHDINHGKKSPVISKTVAKDTVEGDLELSDETCDYVEVSDHTPYDKVTKVQELEECNKNAVLDSIEEGTNKGHECNSNKKERAVFKLGIDTINENKHFNVLNEEQEVKSKESLNKTNKEQKSKEMKNKLSDLFGDTSSLITLDDLGVVTPAATKETLNEYAPSFDNTQDAVDLNVEEMEEVQTRSMKTKRDEDEYLLKNRNQIIKDGKIEKKGKKLSTGDIHNSNNTKKSAPTQHVFKNVNTAPEDNSVVKTVIISTGLQNQCHSAGALRDQEPDKQIAAIQGKTKDNMTNCPAPLSIKALATSTPCKPQNELLLSVPETSCNSNNSTRSNDNVSSKNDSKVTQSNLDIPDVRIIVKRRRKAKGPP